MSNTMRMFQQLSVNLLNMQRGRFKAIDYVMINVPTSFAPIPGRRNFVQQQILGPAPMSLLEFVAALERIGDDPRPLGAILYFRGLFRQYSGFANDARCDFALARKRQARLEFCAWLSHLGILCGQRM